MSEDNGTETALIIRPASLPTVQAMRNKLAERAEVRDLLLTHMREVMVDGQHYGTIPGTDKPMLYQDGARLVQTIFDVAAGKPDLDEEYTEDGHYRCTASVPLISLATGDVLYYGTGSCSTRESKYAHRWVYDNEVPKEVDKASLKSVTREKRGGKGAYTKYLLPNPDLGDLHHTVLTMALKRADTRATLRLPSVADIFMEHAEDKEEDDTERASVLQGLRGWVRTHTELSAAARDAVASVVFRVVNLKAISSLETTMLQQGLAILETTDLDWASPTLREDYKAVLDIQAEDAMVDTYGDHEAANVARHRITQPQSATATSEAAVEATQVVVDEPPMNDAPSPTAMTERELRAAANDVVSKAADACGAMHADLKAELKTLTPDEFKLRVHADLVFVQTLIPQAVAQWEAKQPVDGAEGWEPEAEILTWVDTWAKEQQVEVSVLKEALTRYAGGWEFALEALTPVEILGWKQWAEDVWRRDEHIPQIQAVVEAG